MNIEVFNEQLVNSCWLSLSIPLVVLIRVYELFYESKLLGIDSSSYPMCLGEDPWKFLRFKLKIREEKSEIPSDRPWGATPPRAPQGRLCLTSLGTPRQDFTLVLHASQSAKVT